MTLKHYVLDHLSIFTSGVCAIHCAVLPASLVLFPALANLTGNDHRFHVMLVSVTVPMSIIAAFLGCKAHRNKMVTAGIVTGLVVLVLTALFGHDLVGESGEKIATVLASLTLVFSHVQNYRLCRNKTCHKC